MAKTFEIDSGFAVAHEEMARLQAVRGEFAAAVVSARRAAASGYGDADAILGYSLARSGARADAVALRDQLVRESTTRYVSPSGVALIELGLGNVKSAIDWLAKCVDVRDHEVSVLVPEPLFDSIRNEPGFKRLLAQVK